MKKRRRSRDGSAAISGIALVMSHFACSEEDHPLNAIQMERFRAVRAHFPGIAGSLANSSGIFLGRDAHHDLVRPGVALYGANPTPGKPNPMRTVVTLEGRVVQLREVEQGATVGYSATWTAQAPDPPCGHLGRLCGRISARRKRVRQEAGRGGDRGRSALPDRRPRLDGPDRDRCDGRAVSARRAATCVTLLGKDIGVDDLAERAGTIGYEVLTSLGRRYRRIYRT